MMDRLVLKEPREYFHPKKQPTVRGDQPLTWERFRSHFVGNTDRQIDIGGRGRRMLGGGQGWGPVDGSAGLTTMDPYSGWVGPDNEQFQGAILVTLEREAGGFKKEGGGEQKGDINLCRRRKKRCLQV